MRTPFDHLLVVSPEVMAQELKLDECLERAHRLRLIAEECASTCDAALQGAQAYEQLARRICDARLLRAPARE